MEPTLFLDAASPAIAVGLRARADEAPRWLHSSDEAGVGLFGSIESLARSSGIAVAEIGSAIFCEGPGSLLGVRLVAMTLRTWNALPRAAPLQVLGYRSLELVAADLLAKGRQGPFHVIVDGRRTTWNTISVDARGAWGPIARRPAAEAFAPGETVFHPRGFPLWQALPAEVVSVDYAPEALPELAKRFPLLHPVESPDAFMTEMPTYKEWTPTHPVRPGRT